MDKVEQKVSPTKKLGEVWSYLTEWSGKYQTQIILALIFGLALFMRLWQIGSLPNGLGASEAQVVTQLKNLSFGNLWLGGKFYQAAYIYPAFVIGKIFGLSVRNLRIFSAVIGSGTIVLTYVFIAKWFSRKIAIFTAFLFAISAVHITFSRLILPEIMLPLILLALFICLTDAYRTRNIWLFGLAGVLAAAGLYASPAFILIPFLFLLTGSYFVFKNKKFFSAYRQEIVIAAVAFLAVSVPYLVSFGAQPISYLTYFGFNRSLWQVVVNLSQIPNMLIFSTPANYFLNLGTEPLLDPFIAVTAFAGIFLAVMAASRRKYFFILSWLFVFVLYASLKRGVQIVDLMGILPVIYVFAALALDYVIDKWFTTFPLNKRAQVLAIGVIAMFLALSTLYNFDRYFVGYKNSVMVRQSFETSTIIPLK